MKIFFNISLLIGIFFLPLMLISNSFSAIHNVTNPAEFQAALDIAEDNNEADTINVIAGTYALSNTLTYIFVDPHPLTIIGDGSATTILDGGAIPGANAFRNIMRFDMHPETPIIDDDCDISISGFTFQNGSSDRGGGLFFLGSSPDLTVENCIFDNNFSTHVTWGDGGGIYASSIGNIILQSNIFRSNTSEYYGGGAYITGSVNSVIEDNTFSENTSVGSGGGMYIRAKVISVTNNIFDNNYASYGAAGFYADDGVTSVGSFTITNNTFSNNTGDSGAYIGGQKPTVITGNNFISNGGGYAGGGLEVFSSNELTFDTNRFTGNFAERGGGASVSASIGSTASITNNSFVNNSCNLPSPGAGAGLRIVINGSTVTVTNNTITRNESTGTVYPEYRRGGGVSIDASSYDGLGAISLYNNIVWGNNAEVVDGEDIYISSYTTNTTVNIHNNDFHELYSNIAYTSSNNIDFGPSFVDAPNSDIHLLSTSPCRDVGNDLAPGLPSLDYEGDNRIIGDHVDIGADEYTANLIELGDVNSDGFVDLKDVIVGLQVLTDSDPTGVTAANDVNDDGTVGLEEVIFDLIELSK